MYDEKRAFSFPSADQIHTIQAVTWFPTGQPCRAIIQVSHGMTEYFGRYEEFAHAMTRQGFAVSGHDHLGHKTSVRNDSELGYFAEKDGWKLVIEDLHAHTLALKKQYPGTPVFLLGHSMGSFIARCYLICYSDLLDGAVIVGTGGPNPAAKAGKLLAQSLCQIGKGTSPSPLLHKMAFGSYNRRFDGRTPYDWLTRDVQIVDRYAADPYCTFLFTASGFRDLFTLYEQANRPAAFQAVPKTFPLLVISGGEDPVGGYGEGPRQVAQMLKETGHVDVTLQLYPGGRHEILNETNRREVYDRLAAWIGRRI
ncbi:MAG: alpha/beta fold hydrolase [Oscillospiraceae bacterium]|nr:alpha/beta fold hydrolase [Oscillospiraceae bacterium]